MGKVYLIGDKVLGMSSSQQDSRQINPRRISREVILKRKKPLTPRKIKAQGFFLIYRKSPTSSCSRPKFAFARWTGKAWQRNRFKRWGRHFLREKKPPFNMELTMGFEKREKSFYQRMNYEKFCAGFEKLYTRIR